MFVSGRQRRSKISDLVFEQFLELEIIEADSPEWPDGLPSTGLRLGRTKSTDDAPRDHLPVRRAFIALAECQTAVARVNGPVFLHIDCWGRIFEITISPHSVKAVLKRRLAEI